MTILWCGGEDIDFPDKAGLHWTNGIYCRSAYARGALDFSSTGAYARSPVITPIASCWFSCIIYNGGGSTYWDNTNCRVAGLRNSSVDACIYFGTGSAPGKIALLTYDGSSTTRLAEETGATMVAIQTVKFDMQITNYGPDGSIKVWVDGNLKIDYSGNIAVLGQTTLDQVVFYKPQNFVSYYFSEVIVADEDTRLMSLKTLAPNAAGDTNDWTGAYTDIDETNMSDADVIYTTDVSDDFQANLTGMPSGTFKVKAVKMIVSAADEAAAMGLKVGVKTNAAVHLGTAHSLQGAWRSFEKLYQNNPETVSAFTSGEIEALQLALRTDSTTTTTTSTTT